MLAFEMTRCGIESVYVFMIERLFHVYIMTNPTHTVLYTGVTGNIRRRIFEHQQLDGSSFSTKYNCIKLVYVEEAFTADAAITREKQIKKYGRRKKSILIKSLNPEWRDLSEGF